MHLEGSCHCGAVHFGVRSVHPYPFNLCYCSICRKTAGGGGYAINLGADYATLQVSGEENRAVYQAMVKDEGSGSEKQSPAQRHFCRICGSALWLWDPRWPELVHPFASAIDTDLPVPPQRTHLMVASKASWVEIQAGEDDRIFAGYPDESLAEWHRRLGLVVKRDGPFGDYGQAPRELQPRKRSKIQPGRGRPHSGFQAPRAAVAGIGSTL